MKSSIVLAVTGVALCHPCFAQQVPESPVTQPVAEAMPYDIPYGTPLSLAQARKAIAAAQAEASKHGWKLVCAVAEPTGDLITLDKMDGAQYGSIQVSQDKARTAARFRRATKVFLDATKSGNTYVLSIPGAISAEGGLPIVHDGKLVGAIGCSGAIGNQDATAALAGAEALQ